MRTPETISPYSLLQEEIREEGASYWPWRMMVVCMMLNQTTAKQVRGVMPAFFARYSHPEDAALSDPEHMSALIRSLGFQNRRAASIIQMSREWLYYTRHPHRQLEDVHGLGRYALDSWKIFVDREVPFIKDVDDKELKRYVRWARKIKRSKTKAGEEIAYV